MKKSKKYIRSFVVCPFTCARKKQILATDTRKTAAHVSKCETHFTCLLSHSRHEEKLTITRTLYSRTAQDLQYNLHSHSRPEEGYRDVQTLRARHSLQTRAKTTTTMTADFFLPRTSAVEPVPETERASIRRRLSVTR